MDESRQASSGDKPPVSVVMLTRNRADSLRNALTAIQQQDYPHFEIVVVNNNSTDHTPQVLAEFDVRSEVATLHGVSMLRQHGIELAKNDVIAMIDDDCVPGSNWLSALVQRLQSAPGIALVGGKVNNVNFKGERHFKGMGKAGKNGVITLVTDPDEADYFASMNIIFARQAMQAVGGYDPFFRTGDYEEIDLMTRLKKKGYQCVYEPGAEIEHRHVGVNLRHGRFFRSGQLMRIYFYLKYYQPATLGEWLRFLRYEMVLLRQELDPILRGIGVATVKLEFHRYRSLLTRLFNSLSARLAIPWILWKIRQRRKVEETA